MSDVEELAGVDDQEEEWPEEKAPLRPLPQRLLDAIVSPGRMARTVADNPRWAGALLVCAVLIALSIALTPTEVFEEMQRRVAISSGRPIPELSENARRMFRIFSVVGSLVSFTVISFIGAGLTTFIFAFVLGDEGTYRQYLAVGVHAAVIPTVAALLYVPLRVSAGDPRAGINIATFLFFLPDGFVYNVFSSMDVSQIWSSLVVAVGIHAIDRRRSFASAAAIQLGILLCIALLAGWLVTRSGI